MNNKDTNSYEDWNKLSEVVFRMLVHENTLINKVLYALVLERGVLDLLAHTKAKKVFLIEKESSMFRRWFSVLTEQSAGLTSEIYKVRIISMFNILFEIAVLNKDKHLLISTVDDRLRVSTDKTTINMYFAKMKAWKN